jgi:hypothetical protein
MQLISFVNRVKQFAVENKLNTDAALNALIAAQKLLEENRSSVEERRTIRDQMSSMEPSDLETMTPRDICQRFGFAVKQGNLSVARHQRIKLMSHFKQAA